MMSLLSIEICLVKQVFLIFIIELLYSISHNLLQLDNVQKVPWKRAVIDNLTHIGLGIVSWLVAISCEKMYHPWNIACCLLCGFFAGFVDIDHFLMAKSFKLSDALNLPSRPMFHNTTLMLISILSFILIMHLYGSLKFSYIGWIFLVAVISHHLRDSLHRGLWLWPVNFKPMKIFPCLVLTYCFPAFVGVLIHFIYQSHNILVSRDDFIV